MSWRAPARTAVIGVGALAALGALAACDSDPVARVLHRDSCNVCHEPLDTLGRPHGIEDIHPRQALGCAECHGGNPRVCDGALGGTPEAPTCDGDWLYDKTLAHPPAGPSLRGLAPAELDAVDPAWIRFVNPSDPRVTSATCGRCHTDIAATTRRSGHALQTGDLAIARARSGLQPTTQPRFGVIAQLDPRPDPNDACTASAVTQLSPLPIDPSGPGSSDPRTAPSTANVVDQVLVKACVGCHTSAYGARAADVPAGGHRGAGCAACHVPYAPDGRSVSGDPWVDRQAAGHPLQHVMERAPRLSTCAACHGGPLEAGAQIGRSFQGLLPPDVPALPAAATPPDVHFEAGMTCVDCHHARELHGDGRIGGDATCATPAVACQDCHGTRLARAPVSGSRQRLEVAGPAIQLRTVGGAALPVPQLADAADPSWHEARHDVLACSTCHAGWQPNCYGCHIRMDLSLSVAYGTTGVATPGAATRELLGFDVDGQVLAVNARGEIQGAMLAESIVVTLVDGAGTLLAEAPRTGADGRPARGLRPIDPHTTRRTSDNAACDRCHATGSALAPTNLPALDRTHGFGSDRHVHGGARLDAALAPDGAWLVTPGHAGVRPLTVDEIARMRAVVVPPRTSP